MRERILFLHLYICNIFTYNGELFMKTDISLFHTLCAYRFIRRYLTEKRSSASFLCCVLIFIDSRAPNHSFTFYSVDISTAAPLYKRKSYATAFSFPRAPRFAAISVQVAQLSCAFHQKYLQARKLSENATRRSWFS